jgi:hypothetical protein
MDCRIFLSGDEDGLRVVHFGDFDSQFDPQITFVGQAWNDIDARTNVRGPLNGLSVWADVPELSFTAATESSPPFDHSHQRRLGENANQSLFAKSLNSVIEAWQSLE